MLGFVNLPAKIISIVEGNISPREIAAGVCLGAFLGFIPLNGPMALLLAMFFFFFRINRVATLLTLPIFKAAYLLGIYKLTDAAGTYALAKAGYLAGFWRWITHLPVISYLDINNTLIAGGIIVAATLSIPVYFIAKRLVVFLSAKYSEKIKKSALAKLIPGIKLMGLVGDDTGATLKNVKTQVTLNIKAKIKAAINKGRGAGRPGSLLKRINIIRVAIVAALLLAFHLGVGFIISPAFSSFIVENLNKYSGAKITIDRVNVWPLTLSFSLKRMKVFDPGRPDARIAKIDDSAVMISPLGLLSKRLVFSRIYMKGAEINLEGAPDGTFNIGRLAPAQKEAPKSPAGVDWRSLMQKKDMFGNVYGMIKKRFAGKSKEKIREDLKNAKKVTTTVQDMPKGKLVHFKNAKDLYLFEIRSLDISDAYVKVIASGNTADITNANIRLGRVAYDPENGMRIDLVDLRGDIKKGDKPAGKFDILFSKSIDRNGPKVVCRADLKDIDMDAVRFVYESSLPVHVVKGFITLRSNTHISSGGIDSRNEIYLKDQALEPKAGGNQMMGFVPIAAVCEAINHIDSLRLKFDITGTLEKPEFGGFQESLMALVKPYIANFQERIKSEGLKALDGAADSLKSLFGNKKE